MQFDRKLLRKTLSTSFLGASEKYALNSFKMSVGFSIMFSVFLKIFMNYFLGVLFVSSDTTFRLDLFLFLKFEIWFSWKAAIIGYVLHKTKRSLKDYEDCLISRSTHFLHVFTTVDICSGNQKRKTILLENELKSTWKSWGMYNSLQSSPNNRVLKSTLYFLHYDVAGN